MQHIIIGPQQHIMGMPEPIIDIMLLQHCMNMSFDMPAIGVISQTMPVSVILQVMVHIIMGIIPPIIIGAIPGIAFMPMAGFIPIIIGFMAIIGAMFIGMLPMGIAIA